MAKSSPSRTVLVTGASGGIGLELAQIFACDGSDLILVARSSGKLQEIAARLEKEHSIQVRTIAKDLSIPTSWGEIAKEVESSGKNVDILVNNAGFGLFGDFAKSDLNRELEMIRLNVGALTALTKAFLPGMTSRRSGRILNVASTAAFQPGPGMAVYYATKAYVLSFSEAIAEELTGTGVTVTALCPGPTETGFVAAAKLEGSKLFKRTSASDAYKVALEGYEACLRGDRIVVPGLQNRILAQSVRLMPRRMVTKFVKKFQEPDR